MLDLLTVALEAHSDERNHHRRYEVSVGRDLLEHWVVTIRYGRVGRPLQVLCFSSPHQERARAVIHDRLRRRLSAPRRIGCRYAVRLLSVADGIDLGDWVPLPVLGSLVAA